MARLRQRLPVCVLVVLVAWLSSWGAGVANANGLLAPDEPHAAICRMPHPPGESCSMMHEHGGSSHAPNDGPAFECDCCREVPVGLLEGLKASLPALESASACQAALLTYPTLRERVLDRPHTPPVRPPGA